MKKICNEKQLIVATPPGFQWLPDPRVHYQQRLCTSRQFSGGISFPVLVALWPPLYNQNLKSKYIKIHTCASWNIIILTSLTSIKNFYILHYSFLSSKVEVFQEQHKTFFLKRRKKSRKIVLFNRRNKLLEHTKWVDAFWIRVENFLDASNFKIKSKIQYGRYSSEPLLA